MNRGERVHNLRATLPKLAAKHVVAAHRSPIVMIGRSDISAACARPVLRRGATLGKHPAKRRYSLLAIRQGNEWAMGGPCIDLARTADSLLRVLVHFDPVGDPAGQTPDGE